MARAQWGRGWMFWAFVAGGAALWGGCPGRTELANGAPNQGGGSAGSGAGAAGHAGGGAGAAGGGAGSGSGGSGCPGAVPELCMLCDDGSCGTPTCVNGAWQFECGGGSAGSGGGAAGSSGGGGEACPPNTPVPALCQLCADNSCGTPVCSGGKFTGFVCAGDPSPTPVNCDCLLGAYVPICGVDGQSYDVACGRSCAPVQIACDGECPCTDCVRGGCSGELCVDAGADPVVSDCVFRDEYACYPSATCERQGDGQCGWTQSAELTQCLADAGGGGGGLKWYASCGDPVCNAQPANFDDPNIPNCTTEQMGDACATEGAQCDGVLGCGATLVCSAKDPTTGIGGCPISRARFKQDIDYVSDAELDAYHEQVMSLPLASYHYKHQPNAPEQLGFIIDDIEPSTAVAGDHVNMYGYLSMAVAAIKVQQRQIDALQAELDALRSERGGEAALSCGP